MRTPYYVINNQQHRLPDPRKGAGGSKYSA